MMNSLSFPFALILSTSLHVGLFIFAPELSTSSMPFQQGESSVRLNIVPSSRAQANQQIVAPAESSSPTQPSKKMQSAESGDLNDKGININERLIDLTRPIYPRSSRIKGEEGDVVVLFEIDSLGNAENVFVSESSGFRLLDYAAVKAVKKANFDDVPPSPQKLVFQFRLKDEKN